MNSTLLTTSGPYSQHSYFAVERSPSSPAESPQGPPASWQTIFWILTCLAINSMAQPGGRICGLPSRYRTYLRCSPLICAADVLSILTRLVVSAVYQRLSLLESLGILLHRRFNSIESTKAGSNESPSLETLTTQLGEDEDKAEGIQSLERMTWLRWLWFLLGTLPPAIKLLSMEGIGWSKAWGSMFLISWVVNAMFNQSFFTISKSGRISWPGFEQTTRSPSHQNIHRILDKWDKGLAIAVLVIHVVLMNSVFRIISGRIDSKDSHWSKKILQIGTPATIDSFNGPRTIRDWNYSFRYATPEYTGVTSFGMGFGIAAMSFFVRNQSFNVVVAFFAGYFYLMLVNAGSNLGMYGYVSSSSAKVWGIVTIAAAVFLLLTRFLVPRFAMLSTNLLIAYRSVSDDHARIDYGASLSLAFFLCTLGATLFWYGYVYDPSGTSVPVWTGVFG
jgi:hypothetical protein